MSGPAFNIDFDPRYGELVQVSPLLRRIVCRNPSKFTFYGTGTYVIGHGDVAVVDPGPRDDGHLAALLQALDGETVRHILITHTHGDHSPAAAGLAAATGAPVLGFGPHPDDAVAEGDDSDAGEDADSEDDDRDSDHRGTDNDSDDGQDGEAEADPEGSDDPERDPEFIRKHLPDVDFVPETALAHGDVVHGPGYTVEALHTPGHISNHLCFALGEEHCVLSGDHVMGWSTTIIPPPDGDMAAYLDSLRVLLDREGDERLYPTHGGPVDDAKAYVAALYQHRLDREEGIIGQLRRGPRSATEIVSVLYADVDGRLHKPAARSVVAHLRKLHDEHRARPVSGPADRPASPLRNATVWELV